MRRAVRTGYDGVGSDIRSGRLSIGRDRYGVARANESDAGREPDRRMDGLVEQGCGSRRRIVEALHLCSMAASLPAPSRGRLEAIFDSLDALLDEMDEPASSRILGSVSFRSVRENLYAARARYEFERECAFARRLLGSAASGSTVPIPDSAYWDRHAFEARVLEAYRPRSILFVGSGPYPTSAITFHDHFPDASVTCVDRSERACGLSRQVAAFLGCDRLHVVRRDALDITDFSEYDCVIVGSMVLGNDAESVVDHFATHASRGSALIFRTGSRAGAIKYPTIPSRVLERYDHRFVEHSGQRATTLLVVH